MRWWFVMTFFAGCGSAQQASPPTAPAPLPAEPVVAKPVPPPVASTKHGRMVCIDGLLTTSETTAKVMGVPHDATDPRAAEVAEGACLVLPSMFRCRREALKKGSVAGTLEIALVIDEKGMVTSAKRAGGSIAAGDLSQCIEQALARATFTPAAKGELQYDVRIQDSEAVVAMIENDTDIRGRLRPEIIKPAIRAKFPALRGCYEAQLKKDPDAAGNARFRFVIDEKGTVTDPSVSITGSMNEPSVQSCMLGVIRSLEFPPPDFGKVLRVPDLLPRQKLRPPACGRARRPVGSLLVCRNDGPKGRARSRRMTEIRVLAAGRTDAGRVRNHNEDRVLVARELGLFVVADGMGGHATGHVASAMVTVSLHNFFEATVGQSFAPDAPEDAGLDASALRLVHAVRKANADIFGASSKHPEHKGMGSTIVAVHVDGTNATLAHVGDSRCYRLRGGTIEQLTNDHSLLGEALRHKPDLSEAERACLPKNVITRALGLRPDVKVDSQQVRLEPGDLLLLCSDGLHGMLDDATIASAARLHENLDQACELLVSLANEAGGHDNISVVLVSVVEDEPTSTVEATEVPVEDAAALFDGVLSAQDLERMQRGEIIDVSVSRCSACGTVIPEGNAFCSECGRPVA